MDEQPQLSRHGPYVVMALLCDRVLQESDGVISIVRVVDRIILPQVDNSTRAMMPPLSVTVVLSLKPGNLTGHHQIKLVPPPSLGMKTTEIVAALDFPAEDVSVNIFIPFALSPARVGEGLHWIDVFIDEILMTRLSLRVTFDPNVAIPPGLLPPHELWPSTPNG